MMSPSELHFAPKKIKLDVREISVSTQLAPLHRSLFILFLLTRSLASPNAAWLLSGLLVSEESSWTRSSNTPTHVGGINREHRVLSGEHRGEKTSGNLLQLLKTTSVET